MVLFGNFGTLMISGLYFILFLFITLSCEDGSRTILRENAKIVLDKTIDELEEKMNYSFAPFFIDSTRFTLAELDRKVKPQLTARIPRDSVFFTDSEILSLFRKKYPNASIKIHKQVSDDWSTPQIVLRFSKIYFDENSEYQFAIVYADCFSVSKKGAGGSGYQMWFVKNNTDWDVAEIFQTVTMN